MSKKSRTSGSGYQDKQHRPVYGSEERRGRRRAREVSSSRRANRDRPHSPRTQGNDAFYMADRGRRSRHNQPEATLDPFFHSSDPSRRNRSPGGKHSRGSNYLDGADPYKSSRSHPNRSARPASPNSSFYRSSGRSPPRQQQQQQHDRSQRSPVRRVVRNVSPLPPPPPRMSSRNEDRHYQSPNRQHQRWPEHSSSRHTLSPQREAISRGSRKVVSSNNFSSERGLNRSRDVEMHVSHRDGRTERRAKQELRSGGGQQVDGRSRHMERSGRDADGGARYAERDNRHMDSGSRYISDGGSRHVDRSRVGGGQHVEGGGRHIDGRSRPVDDRNRHVDGRSRPADDRGRHAIDKGRHAIDKGRHSDDRGRQDGGLPVDGGRRQDERSRLVDDESRRETRRQDGGKRHLNSGSRYEDVGSRHAEARDRHSESDRAVGRGGVSRHNEGKANMVGSRDHDRRDDKNIRSSRKEHRSSGRASLKLRDVTPPGLSNVERHGTSKSQRHEQISEDEKVDAREETKARKRKRQKDGVSLLSSTEMDVLDSVR